MSSEETEQDIWDQEDFEGDESDDECVDDETNYEEDSFKVTFSSTVNDHQDFLSSFESGSVPKVMRNIHISGVVDPNDQNYPKLIHLLHTDPRKWSKIEISGPELEQERSSPAFIALLASIFGKTDLLDLRGCMDDSAAYSCLSAGLMLQNGIRNLHLSQYSLRSITKDQADILSRGLASSPSLETFRIQSNLTTSGVETALVRGLKLNKSLLSVEMMRCKFSKWFLPHLFTVLQKHPKLRRFISCSQGQLSSCAIEILCEWLEIDGCKLEVLGLWHPDGAKFPRLPDRQSIKKNTSLKELRLLNYKVCSSTLDLFLKALPELDALVSLDLSENVITSLSPLEIFLCGCDTTLQTLRLSNNSIETDDIQKLVEKISCIGTLKTLDVKNNPFTSSKISTAAFLEALNKFSSLERIRLHKAYTNVRRSNEQKPLIKSKIQSIQTTNPTIRCQDNVSLPKGLWPLVFEKAMDLRHCQTPLRKERTDYVERRSALQATLLYSILRKNGHLFNHQNALLMKEC
jgi:hypothetical protein